MVVLFDPSLKIVQRAIESLHTRLHLNPGFASPIFCPAKLESQEVKLVLFFPGTESEFNDPCLFLGQGNRMKFITTWTVEMKSFLFTL